MEEALSETGFILFHELCEREIMSLHNMKYDPAHDFSNIIE